MFLFSSLFYYFNRSAFIVGGQELLKPNGQSGDLLLPSEPNFSLIPGEEEEEGQILNKDPLELMRQQMSEMADQVEIARIKEQDLRIALGAEKKERLEREKALQDQIAVLAARLDKEKKASRKFEDDYKYYRGKYLHLTRGIGGNQRPAVGEVPNPPIVRMVDQILVQGEAAPASSSHTIPAARVERDAARLHTTLNHLHRNVSQMYSILLQTGDQVARLHREDSPPEH